jgi:hypothetical protein
MPRPLALAALLAVLAAVALPAAAGDWVVTLHNGTELVSRYQPEEASWDPEVVLLLTADGNLVGLSRADIASVSSDIESRGFGTVIDDKTRRANRVGRLDVGWSGRRSCSHRMAVSRRIHGHERFLRTHMGLRRE